MIADDHDATVEQDEELAKISREAKPWCALLGEAEDVFEPWQEECDRIDRLYGNLKEMSRDAADREMQMFWASIEVIVAVIYARPPIPQVSPKHRDRKELPRKAADMLERALMADFEADDVDGTMQLVRDDQPLSGRGTVRIRYDVDPETGAEICPCEYVDRKDFRHGPARKWRDVPWVAYRSYLGIDEFRQRFPDASWTKAAPAQRGIGTADEDDGKGERLAEVWEIWHKKKNIIAFVSTTCEEVLDLQRPPVKLTGFFDCPKPAYGTLQRRTLIPIPDFFYIRDQIEEINDYTARIAALSEALKVKGFYAAGSAEFAEAIEAALGIDDDRKVMIPVPAAALGAVGDGMKNAVVWLPIDMVVEVIRECVALRRQVIDDIYQIYGLSDIMRGDTEASETATAQQIKAQYGGIRVRRRQKELVRFARDIARIKAEIMAEAFSMETLLTMSQVEDIPSAADVQRQVAQLMQQAQQAAADPQAMAMAQQNPQQAQAMAQQAQGQIQTLQNTVTIEAIEAMLRSQRLRPFVLDIETDSTIEPDENAAKERATEFAAASGALMQGAVPLVVQFPMAADMVTETIRFVASAFKSTRQLDAAIDEFGEKLKAQAQAMQQAQQGPSPEQMKAQAEAEAKKAELQMKAQEAQQRVQADQQKAASDLQLQREKMQGEAQIAIERMNREFEIKMEQMRREFDLKARQMASEIELKREMAREDAELKRDVAEDQAEIARTKAKAQQNGDARQ